MVTMIVRVLVIFTVVNLVVVANFFSPNRHARVIALDLAYIAENCAGLANEQARSIGDFVEPMGAFTGTDYYLFDRASDGTPQNHSLVALRDFYEEPLCFPVVGCLIAPQLRGSCLPD